MAGEGRRRAVEANAEGRRSEAAGRLRASMVNGFEEAIVRRGRVAWARACFCEATVEVGG